MAEEKYKGYTTEQLFNFYSDIKDKYPGLQKIVNDNIKGNPDEGDPKAAYDAIIKVHENEEAKKKSLQKVVNPIYSLEQAIYNLWSETFGKFFNGSGNFGSYAANEYFKPKKLKPA